MKKTILFLCACGFSLILLAYNETQSAATAKANGSAKPPATNTSFTPPHIILNYSPTEPACTGNVPGIYNKDLQLFLSEPADHDIEFTILLAIQESGSYYDIPSPWMSVRMAQGENVITLPATCQIDGSTYLPCKNKTETLSADFRISVVSAKYIDEAYGTFNYTFAEGKNYFDFNIQKFCLGDPNNPRD